MSQLIFDGFATKGNIDRARAQLNLAFASLNGQKATVSFNLKSAFAQLLYAQKLIKISRDVVDIRKSNARLVKLLYEGGSEDKRQHAAQPGEPRPGALQSRPGDAHARSLRRAARRLHRRRTCPRRCWPRANCRPIVLPVTPDFRQARACVTPLYFRAPGASVDAAAAGLTIANSGWYPTITADAIAHSRSDDQFPLQEPRLVRRILRLVSAFPGRRDLLRREGGQRLAAPSRSIICAPARTTPR